MLFNFGHPLKLWPVLPQMAQGFVMSKADPSCISFFNSETALRTNFASIESQCSSESPSTRIEWIPSVVKL